MQTTMAVPGGAEAAAMAACPPRDIRAVRRYCTYFDGNYALRALVMIESLRRHEPDAAIHALCFDETAASIIRDRAPATHVTTLAELEAFDPQLAAAKSNRSPIEFFFTCTPCFPRYLLDRHPDSDSITYLDADMVFFESPARIFAETGAASVAIVPHNFTPPLAACVAHGIYNVSWVMWRNDAEGRRCLDDYRADCLRWCHDRLEAGRFADQKYLDAWPDRYRGVHVVRGKGVNLAVWNADNYDLRDDAGKVTVDGEPLVFFHGHAITHVGPAHYELRFADYGVRRNAAFLQDVLYRPYVVRLNALFEELAGTYGLTIRGDVRGQQALEAARGQVAG